MWYMVLVGLCDVLCVRGCVICGGGNIVVFLLRGCGESGGRVVWIAVRKVS